MKSILVTGSNGQLGNEIRRLAENFDLDFIFTDVSELDITDEAQVNTFIRDLKPEFVVNCAAYTAVEKAEDDREFASLLNAKAPGFLAEYCAKYNVRMIHVSTDYVFDGKNYKPYCEDDRVNPLSVYGKTKLEGEILVKLALKNSMIVRTSWLYSSFGNNFVKTMIKLGKSKDKITVVSDQIGTPTYAADLASFIVDTINNTLNGTKEFVPGIFHYSNEGVCSWYDFAQEIMTLCNLPCTVLPIESKNYPVRVERPFYSVLNKAKIRDTFGVEVPYWKTSLVKCLKEITKE
ncbi:MAG: dTDP-4-dehydrorhamnose reductase [Bacteroidota bacterium]|nr:dTDP-4-dehydrorhamnose reductase [Bacteroidota bacterium]MDP4204930.1 dTDP-4-dehydrorhamnose reductase [Bacteroidota bacterium]